MKLFQCQVCSNILYFENRFCGRCGHRVGFLPEMRKMVAMEPDGEAWRAAQSNRPPRFFCRNAEQDACNWLVPDGTTEAYCVACRYNGIVPDIADPARLAAWRELEFAKHRLIYSLLRWKLPLHTRNDDPNHGLIFDFLADWSEQAKVMTGHENGVITIALTEADDLERERRRLEMGEPYRTLLGHMRHEVGHHFWDVLVRDGGQLDSFRTLFGDDREDYQEALQRYYANGAPEDWQENYVSAYASAHPWEDFAETWAHYIHIVDTLEMATEFGLDVKPRIDRTGDFTAQLDFDPYRAEDVTPVIEAWIPFVFAMNNVSRTMGTRELYPFVLSPTVITKLGYIHDLVHDRLPRVAMDDATPEPVAV